MLGRTTKTITISLAPELAQEVDKVAGLEKKSKSQLFRDMFSLYREMAAEREWQELRKYGSQRAKEMGITTEEDIDRIINEVRGV